MGQNIRGFCGWRSDHEYFIHEWSDFAYLYLQQPRKYYPRNVSILLNHEYFVPRKSLYGTLTTDLVKIFAASFSIVTTPIFESGLVTTDTQLAWSVIFDQANKY